MKSGVKDRWVVQAVGWTEGERRKDMGRRTGDEKSAGVATGSEVWGERTQSSRHSARPLQSTVQQSELVARFKLIDEEGKEDKRTRRGGESRCACSEGRCTIL